MKKHENGLSAWQLTMMALGSVIGGSFFLGSAVAIHAAGPSVILGFAFGGILVYYILYALSEMTVANPDSGSFRTFAAQAFGRGTGFVVGWVYWTGMVLAMSSEATAVSILLRDWFPKASIALIGSIIIVAVTLLNLLGASRLGKLESGLAAVKLIAVITFILIGLSLILGLLPGNTVTGLGAVRHEAWLPNGWRGLAGSMLIVMFTYAGFEVIGLAASETSRPKETIPRAIRYTVISLLALYLVFITVLLPLIPTAAISENTSPIVAALARQGIPWVGSILNFVLITAIFSTMLANMFGLGRMIRSLATEGLAPAWLKDRAVGLPYRGILASGGSMLLALWFGLLLPRVYLFLISSGGFAILFSYVIIMATHMRLRRKNGCPDGQCRMWGYPYSSLLVLAALLATIISMPFVAGQASGLVAGCVIVVFYICAYWLLHFRQRSRQSAAHSAYRSSRLQTETSDELTDRMPDDPREE